MYNSQKYVYKSVPADKIRKPKNKHKCSISSCAIATTVFYSWNNIVTNFAPTLIT